MCRTFVGSFAGGWMGRAVASAVALVLLSGCIDASETTSAAEIVPAQRHDVDPEPEEGPDCPDPAELLLVGMPLETEGPALGFDLVAASADDPLRLSSELVAVSYGCLDMVVVAASDVAANLALASMLAHIGHTPLIVVPGSGSAEDVGEAAIQALRSMLTERVTTTVLTVGGDLTWLADDDTIVDELCIESTMFSGCEVDATAAAILARVVAENEASGTNAALDESDEHDAIDVLVASMAPDDPALAALLRAMLDRPDDNFRVPIELHEGAALGDGIGPEIAGQRDDPTLWLGDVRDPVAAMLAATTAAHRGERFVAVDGDDLRAVRERTERLRASEESRVVIVGEPEAHTAWQLATVLGGTPLPGGGFLPLEGQRIVALYGAPGFPGLGALGQQDLDATVERARTTAEPYGTDGRRVVPGFNVIVTVASRNAGAHGDYSQRIPIDALRPLVDRAREEGFAVIIDLQPGRTSFLDQAMEYEELLLEPHVGLALDAEWRIGPTEVHLARIGSVEAAEVQQVADWLAELVRRERLPQKVFMLHQFVGSMLPDRDTIVISPELVGVVHVDGQGTLRGKRRTYEVTSQDAISQWEWGWKNFLGIDRPVATPEQVLELDPLPFIVTYQ
ncbi:MAG: hypothetical protein WD358_05355 [Nitriliruptoraceae bacterium]